MKPAIAMASILWLTVVLTSATFVVPDFRDTTIKTRITRGVQPPSVVTLRLKGPRGRSESVHGSTGAAFLTRIWQCDQKASVTLHDFNKTYEVFPIRDLEERGEDRKERMPAPPKNPGPVVTVTTDSEDTGERRQKAGYEVKHIKTTIVVDPAEGAGVAASKTEIDGWYADLPGLFCSSREDGVQPPIAGWLVRTSPGTHAKFKYVNTGDVVPGYTLEEVATVRSERNVVIHKIELLEFSDRPLEESLFEVPAGYTEKPHPVLDRQFSPTKPSE